MTINPIKIRTEFAPLKALLLVLPLLLVSCEEKVDLKDPAIQREISRRTEVIRKEMKTDEDIRRTVRVVAICILAGGTIFGVYRLVENGKWPSSHKGQDGTTYVRASRHNIPPTGRRIIDLPGSNPKRRRNS